MGFTYIDLLILIAYIVGITYFGIRIAGKQTTTKDYFLGGKKIPWWAVCFAIVAAETSTLTVISVPGLAYVTNLNFLQIAFGYLIGRIVVSFVILPAYFRGELGTAYTFLATRFGTKMKNIASGTFMLTRLAADGVRLFATAIPLAVILRGTAVADALSHTEIYILSIAIIALVALTYTFIGGIRSVIWIDVIQMFIYIGGAIAAIIIVVGLIPGGLGGAVSEAFRVGKLQIFNFAPEGGIGEFFKTPYTFLGGIIGGAFLSMASHGIDQLIVQRLLTTGSVTTSRKALIGTGVIVIMQFAVFLFLGSLLYVYYGGADIMPDEVFPTFIVQEMPTGLSGLIIAGLFAAAMSTLAGSISALTSATVYDYLIPYSKLFTEDNQITISRVFIVVWSVLLAGSALLFMQSPQAVVELALSIASFTYGGLLGTFFLGVLFTHTKQKHAIPAFFAGILTMVYVILFTPIAWTWYTLIGTSVTVAVGLLLSKIMKGE
jgi:solute:Na+ symporter, SSS family